MRIVVRVRRARARVGSLAILGIGVGLGLLVTELSAELGVWTEMDFGNRTGRMRGIAGGSIW